MVGPETSKYRHVTALVPTVGRKTLVKAVESALAIPLIDSVWVVADGEEAYGLTCGMLYKYSSPRVMISNTPSQVPRGDWGHWIRHVWGPSCPTGWVIWLDDDNLLNRAGIEMVFEQEPRSDLLVCDVVRPDGAIVPGNRPIAHGAVDGLGLITRTSVFDQCVYWPAGGSRSGDWTFYQSIVNDGHDFDVTRFHLTVGTLG